MQPMSVPRVTMNAVLLPTGKILTLGGSTTFNDPATAHLTAQTFGLPTYPQTAACDPALQTWTPAGAGAYARMYHSTRAAAAGRDGVGGRLQPHARLVGAAAWRSTSRPISSRARGAPAPRPTITATSPSVVGYGQTFTVTTPNAASISKVVLMRPGSNTHAFDAEQRLIHTYFTTGSGALTVTAPTSTGAAPPGYYMVFIIDANGVPSVAKFIQILPNPTNQPPSATITSPSTANVTIPAGQSVTFTGTASDPGGSIAQYAWVFPGGLPAKKAAMGSNPGSQAVTFATPGVYTVSLTVVDNLGANNPSPPTVTVTVTGGALGAAITSPTYAASVSGNVTVTMAASDAQGTPINYLLKVDNTITVFNQSFASSDRHHDVEQRHGPRRHAHAQPHGHRRRGTHGDQRGELHGDQRERAAAARQLPQRLRRGQHDRRDHHAGQRRVDRQQHPHGRRPPPAAGPRSPA